MEETVKLIQEEFKRRVFEESYARIENCLNKLNETQIWHRPNSNTNSIGNLVLHLMGNMRQYICSGIGSEKDIRQRDQEFLSSSQCDKKELIKRMHSLQNDVLIIVGNLSEEKLLKMYSVQGFSEAGLSIVIHVIEHFSYHVGQIALYTKLLKDVDLGFYADLDLNIKSE